MKPLLTVVVQIGNSDDKLPQKEWAFFQKVVSDFVCRAAHEVHFFGHSEPLAAWQNMCMVIVTTKAELDDLRHDLGKAAERYHQDSIALTIGETEFVTP